MSLSPQEVIIPSPFPSPKSTNIQQSTPVTPTKKKDKKKNKEKDSSHRSPLISILDLLEKPRHHGKLSRSTSSTDFRGSIVINRMDMMTPSSSSSSSTTNNNADTNNNNDVFIVPSSSSSTTSSILDPELPPPIRPTRNVDIDTSTDKHPQKQAIDQDTFSQTVFSRNAANVYAITSPRHRKPIRETKETLSPFISAVSNPLTATNASATTLNSSLNTINVNYPNNHNLSINSNTNINNSTSFKSTRKNQLTNISINTSTLDSIQDDVSGTDNITKYGNINSEHSALFNIEKSVALQERSFCDVLDVILTGYMQPIRAQIDADYENDPITHGQLVVDMTPLFDGLANLYRSALVQLERLTYLTERNAHFWIVKAYADYTEYVSAYRSFLNAHRRAIEKLASFKAVNSPLANYVKSASEALAKSKKSQYTGCILDDLLRFCVARLSYLSNLAKAQYSIVMALKNSRETCIISDFFSITCHYTFDKTKILKEANMGIDQDSNPLENIEGVDEAFSIFHDMETTAGKLCEIYTRRDMESSIFVVDDKIPFNIERVFRGKTRATLIESSEFGLSTERPIWLAFFSDALAILSLDKRTKQDARPLYELIRWVPEDVLSIYTIPEISPTACNLRRKLYKLALRATNNNNNNNSNNSINSNTFVPSTPPLTASSSSPESCLGNSSNTGIPLPPGWEMGLVKGKQRVYTYTPDGISQGTEPRMAPELVNEVLIAVPADISSVWDEWVAKHQQQQQAQGSAWDDRPDLYRQIGSSLEEVLAYEQAFYPGENTPLLFRILTNTLLRRGFSEEGIFRISWDTNENARLIAAVNSGRATCAGVKKVKVTKKRWWHGSSDSDSTDVSASPSAQLSTSSITTTTVANPNVSSGNINSSGGSSNIGVSTSGNATSLSSSSSVTTGQSGNNNSGNSDDIDFNACHPHAVANLLKAFFRYMTTPVIPVSFYRRFHALVAEAPPQQKKGSDNTNDKDDDDTDKDDDGASEGITEMEKVEAFRNLVNELPKPNYVLLRDLIQFLYTVSCSKKLNHMPASNLAIVFAVNLMWETEESKSRPMEIIESNKVVTFLIEHSTEIFGDYLNPGSVPSLTAATIVQVHPDSTAPFIHLRHKILHRKVSITYLFPPHSRPVIHTRKHSTSSALSTTPTVASASLLGIPALLSISSSSSSSVSSPLAMPADNVSEGPWTLSSDGMLTSWSRASFSPLTEMPTTLSNTHVVAVIGKSLWAALPKGSIVVLSKRPSGAAPTVIHTPGPVSCITTTNDDTVWCGCNVTNNNNNNNNNDANNNVISNNVSNSVITIISAETHEKYGEIAIDGQITAIHSYKDTIWCTVYREGSITQELRVYDVMTSELLKTVQTPGPARVNVIASGGHDFIWTGDAAGTICVWSANSCARVATLRRHSAGISTIASPDRSDQVWTAGNDGSLFVWMAIHPFLYVGEIRGYNNAPVVGVCGFSGGDEVWSAAADGSVCVWKVDQIPHAFMSLDNVK